MPGVLSNYRTNSLHVLGNRRWEKLIPEVPIADGCWPTVDARLVQVLGHAGDLWRFAQPAERLALDLAGALAGDP